MGKTELEWLYSTQKVRSREKKHLELGAKIELWHQQFEVMNPSSVDSFVAYNRSY